MYRLASISLCWSYKLTTEATLPAVIAASGCCPILPVLSIYTKWLVSDLIFYCQILVKTSCFLSCTAYTDPACALFAPTNLLAGKCSLAIRGRGARVFWSNPLTQTNPANIHNKKKRPLIQYCNPKMSFLSLRRHDQLVKPESHLSFCNSSIREMMVLVFRFILDNITKLGKDPQVFYSQIGRWIWWFFCITIVLKIKIVLRIVERVELDNIENHIV